MLEHLAKKDKLWRQTAFNICKCKDLADELTNLMYLRIYNYNVPIDKLTENYVGFVIYNLFRDHCKRIKDLSLDWVYDNGGDAWSTEDYSTLINTITVEEPTGFDDDDSTILTKAGELKWWEQQLLSHSYDKSLRQIEKEFNINYKFVYNNTNRCRRIILGEDYNHIKQPRHSNTATRKEDKRTKSYKNGKRTA
jgi:hypothetical protein